MILTDLGQESGREGEVVSWEAALSAPGRVAMKCQEAPFAASAQKIGREGLHIMTAPMRPVHEGCGSGHITVGGADNDLRNALATARQGVHRRQSRALSVASRAGVSLQTQGKCGLGRLRRATDGHGPGERQRRRAGELGSRFVGMGCACSHERDASAKKRCLRLLLKSVGEKAYIL